MRINGALRYKIATQGGIDESGDPIKVEASWSDAIDCLIIPNGKGTILKYQDGEQVKANYEIHLEGIKEFENTNPEIEIFNNRGVSLGKYQVLPPNIQELQVAGRTTITV